MKLIVGISFALLILSIALPFQNARFNFLDQKSGSENYIPVGAGVQRAEQSSSLKSVKEVSDSSGPGSQLSSIPSVSWDEQLALTISQASPVLSYNVTAVEQSDANGYGPGYLLNGLTDKGYWYQVGIAWDWPLNNNGFSPGFKFIYEVWSPSGSSIFPTVGESGLLNYSGTINSGDEVLLSLNFSDGQIVMYSKDWSTNATASINYTSAGGAIFVGLQTQYNSNHFFSGLMTEQYHTSAYYGSEAQVTYSNPFLGLNAAVMWIDEYNINTNQMLFSMSSPDISYSNPNQLQTLSSNGSSISSTAYQFTTDSSGDIEMTLSYSIDGGGSGFEAPLLDYVSNGTPYNVTLSTSPTQYFMDKGTTWTIPALLNGSTSSERWMTNQSGGVVSGTHTIVIPYLHEYELSIGVNRLGSGIVQPIATGWYEAGILLNISAVPNNPYLFSNWISNSGNITFTNSELSNTTAAINGAGYITAEFTVVTISLTSYSGTVTQGSSIISIARIIGNNEVVTLTASGLPNGTSIGWHENPFTDNLTGVMDTINISTSSSSPEGIYHVWINASSMNETDAVQFVLKINAADPLTVNFSTNDNSYPNPPTISYVYNGSDYESVLSSTPQVIYLDNGSTWQITSILSNSTSTVRWILNAPAEGIATGPLNISSTYYHQYLIGFTFGTFDKSSFSEYPTVNFTSFGNVSSILANGTKVWADSGTDYKYSISVMKSDTERLELADNLTGIVDQTATVNATYYHQYLVESSFTLLGRNSISVPPSFTFISQGRANTTTLSQNASTNWIDSGSAWSSSQNLSGTSVERWFGSNTSGTVNSQNAIAPEYTPQFYVVIQQNTPVSGSTSPQQGWYTLNTTLSISAVANHGWKFMSWSGTGAQANSSSMSMLVNRPLNITAEFYSALAISSGSNGQVGYLYGSNSGTVPASSTATLFLAPGTNVSLSASPNSPFYSTGPWSIGNDTAGTSSLESFSISAPTTIGVSFGLNITIIALIGAVVLGLIITVAFLAMRRSGKQFASNASHSWKW